MELLQYLDLAATILAVVLIMAFWTDVRRQISQVASRLPRGAPRHVHNVGAIRAGGYALWAYRQSQWRLEKDCSEPGFECGGPPGRAGWYEGEIVRTACIRNGDG